MIALRRVALPLPLKNERASVDQTHGEQGFEKPKQAEETKENMVFEKTLEAPREA